MTKTAKKSSNKDETKGETNLQSSISTPPSVDGKTESNESRTTSGLSSSTDDVKTKEEEDKQLAEWWTQLAERTTELHNWNRSCPANFSHQLLIVKAETARLKRKPLAAQRMFVRAIAGAKANEWTYHEVTTHITVLFVLVLIESCLFGGERHLHVNDMQNYYLHEKILKQLVCSLFH
jgi:hypothetical protein